MTGQENLKQFDEIYDKTYYEVLRFVVCNSYNINDVNDIMQETYLEFYKILNKRSLDYTNITAFIKGIANNKIKKHYSLLYKLKTISLFDKNNKDIEHIETIKEDIDLDKIIMDDEMYCKAWEYIKTKRPIVSKIFFLYYSCDSTIKEISEELNVSESYVKNSLYRTLKGLKNAFRKDSD